MNEILKNVGVIILAAGKGTRLNCGDLPKVLLHIGDKPIVGYILDELNKGGVSKDKISLVIGYQAEKVKKEFGEGYKYAIQEKQLGTAHAAHTGEQVIDSAIDTILILQGDDTAFYKFESLEKFVKLHKDSDNDITLLTCEVEDSSDLGRVIRNKQGDIQAVLEKEQVTPEQAKIKEVNTGTFCFKKSWFREHYKNLDKIPGLGELGLPSFIEEAVKTNAKFQAVKLDNPKEWFGINNKEQLEKANEKKNKISRENIPKG